ncbi:hypothetical protein C0J52_17199 [Blattella germanica]|nr:hypothetical protein C0J52_17199 [Blattella germanica]
MKGLTINEQTKTHFFTACDYNLDNLQLGMLMPAGMPLPEKVRTSSEVKSGRRNLSFSKLLGQGSSGRRTSAFSTRLANLADISLLTMATNPSNSPLIPAGSR